MGGVRPQQAEPDPHVKSQNPFSVQMCCRRACVAHCRARLWRRASLSPPESPSMPTTLASSTPVPARPPHVPATSCVFLKLVKCQVFSWPIEKVAYGIAPPRGFVLAFADSAAAGLITKGAPGMSSSAMYVCNLETNSAKHEQIVMCSRLYCSGTDIPLYFAGLCKTASKPQC